MKVISIKEPFATLIKENIKNIETRSWKTNYRGEIYIHASKVSDKTRTQELLELTKDLKMNLCNICSWWGCSDNMRLSYGLLRQSIYRLVVVQ